MDDKKVVPEELAKPFGFFRDPKDVPKNAPVEPGLLTVKSSLLSRFLKKIFKK